MQQRVTDEQLSRRQVFVDQGMVPEWVGDLIADLRAFRAEAAEWRDAEDALQGRVVARDAKIDGLQQRINKALEGHHQYLPAAVDFDCCEACNRASSGYVPYPCPVRAALTGTDGHR